jgi:hypothetical protein
MAEEKKEAESSKGGWAIFAWAVTGILALCALFFSASHWLAVFLYSDDWNYNTQIGMNPALASALSTATWMLTGIGAIVAVIVGYGESRRIRRVEWLSLAFTVYLGTLLTSSLVTSMMSTNSYIALAPSRVEVIDSSSSSSTVYLAHVKPSDVLASNMSVTDNAVDFSFIIELPNSEAVTFGAGVPGIYKAGGFGSTTVAGVLNPLTTDDAAPEIFDNRSLMSNVRVDTMSSAGLAQLRVDMEKQVSQEAGYGASFWILLLIMLGIMIIPAFVNALGTRDVKPDEQGRYTFNLPLWVEIFNLIYKGTVGVVFLYAAYELVLAPESNLADYVLMLPIYVGYGGYSLYSAYQFIRNSRDELHLDATMITIRDNDVAGTTVCYDSVSSVVVHLDDGTITVNDTRYDLGSMNLKGFVKQIADVAKKYYNAEIIEKSTTESAKKSDSGTRAT